VTLMSQPNERVVVSGHQAITGWTSIGGGIYTASASFKPTALYVNNTAIRGQQALGGQIEKGTYCLTLYESAVPLTAPLTYTVRVSHP